MKKFLLTLTAALGIGVLASAETYTYKAAEIMGSPDSNFEFKSLADNTAYCGGFAFTALKNSGSTEPTFNVNNKDLRIYAKGTLQIKANGANITGLSFEISAQGLKRFPDVTPSAGAIDKQGENPLVWAGSAADVTFTVGDKAIYGTDGADKAGQFDFASVTITTDGPVTDFDVTPSTPDTPEEVYAIYEQATAMAAGSYVIYAEERVAVPLTSNYGYIQVEPAVVANQQITTSKVNGFEFVAVDGGYNILDSNGKYVYQTGTYNSFNVSEGFKEDVDAASYVWTVEVKDGKFVITNTAVEKSVQYDLTYGSFGSYPDERGVYPVLYKYVKDAEGDAPVIERTSVTSLNQLASITNNELIQMDVDLTVIYANGSYNYVCEGNNFGLIYKKDLGLEAGMVVTKGWTGKVSIYNNLIELVPDDATLASTAGGKVPSPVAIQGDEAETALVPASQNAYVLLESVVFDAATPAADASKGADGNDLRNFTGKFGDATVDFYQRFGVESVEAGTYDVIGFISVYKETVQVYPIRFEQPGGIAGIANDNGSVEYYNIQGVKVANPREGNLYIRVQGGNASKVIF